MIWLGQPEFQVSSYYYFKLQVETSVELKLVDHDYFKSSPNNINEGSNLKSDLAASVVVRMLCQ